VNGRCGPGTRVPLVVISPYARSNYVDHTLITQASVVKFIEDNWLGGTRLGGGSHDATTGSLNALFDFTNGGATPAVYVDTNTGAKLSSAPATTD
jgi:phospholipase C